MFLGLVIIGIVFLIKTEADAYVVATIWIGVYAVIFPVSLTLYGVKLFITIRKSQKVSFVQFKVSKKQVLIMLTIKFTRFTMIANVVVAIDGLVLIVTAVNFVLGWDVFGLFFVREK